jgi:phytoene synthase
MTAAPTRALADVKARVEKSRTSFHAGMKVLPKNRREAMYALYAFCREVDDIADDSLTPDIAARDLQKWRQRIAALFQSGTTDNSITAALLPCIAEFGLVEQDFQTIIDGMAMDAASVIVAPDAATLDLYCDRVASAVGRVSVRIFGDSSTNAMQVAHHLGRALQLTNILRDLAEDAARERLYLPREILEKNGITEFAPVHVLGHPNLPQACRELAAQADMHFQKADQAMDMCTPSAMRPARVMRAYYAAILERLRDGDWRDVTSRISLPSWQKAWLMVRFFIG